MILLLSTFCTLGLFLVALRADGYHTPLNQLPQFIIVNDVGEKSAEDRANET